jgi:molybdopterin/thiamine biosynthesis adenylyltransferase
MLTIAELEKYDRQISLDEIGQAGQEKLRQAKVFICGAGGLGSPAALYLAAAGIGSLKIIDPDHVALSNLNRQILHGESDVGRFKVDSARDCLNRLNPLVAIETLAEALTADNAADLADGSDVIIDALDNLDARCILNKAAVNLCIPLIHGAVNGFEGRVLTILPGRSACLSCLHAGPSPPSGRFPIIGVTPAVIGAIQATEAVKVLLGVGDLLQDRLLVYDGLKLRWTEFKVKLNPDCGHCGHLQQKEAP